MMVQHLGGVLAFLRKKRNPQHKAFGRILANIGRMIAAVGWVLGGNEQNAMIVAGVSAVLLILHLLTSGEKKKVT